MDVSSTKILEPFKGLIAFKGCIEIQNGYFSINHTDCNAGTNEPSKSRAKFLHTGFKIVSMIQFLINLFIVVYCLSGSGIKIWYIRKSLNSKHVLHGQTGQIFNRLFCINWPYQSDSQIFLRVAQPWAIQYLSQLTHLRVYIWPLPIVTHTVRHKMWNTKCDTQNVTHKMWHTECDTQNVTRKMWHTKCDTQNVTHIGRRNR